MQTGTKQNHNTQEKEFLPRQLRKPELLIPASSLEVLRTAVYFGADAVYIGGEAFSLRAKARNFSQEEMAEGVAFARRHGVKVYVTANILAHNDDLEEAREYFAQLRDLSDGTGCPAAPDALIISDPGLFLIAKEVWPQAEIHISTQANNTNYETCLFWHRLGAKRVVTGRELSLQEIRAIREKIPEDMEIESFVHGAMCISYSGRCLLSNYFTGRDANQGACTHPCRWKYAVMEESRPGEYLPVYENERGTFLFNSKDLCMIEHIPELAEAGIDSFKIEGRMKTALYVAVVTRAYRRAIDDFFADAERYRANLDLYRKEIGKCTHRQYSTGFYFGKPDQDSQIYDNSTYVNEYTYLGIIEETRCPSEDGRRGEENCCGKTLVRITQRNKFCVGDCIEVMKPDGRDIRVKVTEMYDEDMKPVMSAPHAQQRLWLRLTDGEGLGDGAAADGDLLRVKA